LSSAQGSPAKSDRGATIRIALEFVQAQPLTVLRTAIAFAIFIGRSLLDSPYAVATARLFA
jgi:hypothetical protein